MTGFDRQKSSEWLRRLAARLCGRSTQPFPALQHRAVEWNIDSFEDCLANALLESGRYDEALAEYERILKINPNYPLAHYHLGQTHDGKGDCEKARTAYQQFLQVWREADASLPEILAAKQRWARP
jgi:tetratricopeptide (TPR) repeat protein